MYDVVVTGKVSPEEATDAVATRLAALFKISNEQAAGILARPTPVKRNADEPTAQRYQAALLKIGVRCELRAKESVVPDTPIAAAPPPPPPPQPSQPPPPSAPSTAGVIYCYGCGVPIHPSAPACPHCGAPARNISQFGFAQLGQSAPAVVVDNSLVWMLALAPLVCWLAAVVVALVVYGGEVGLSRSDWFTPIYLIAVIALQVLLSTADRKSLERADIDVSRFKDAWLVPVYLFKRADALGQRKHYFITWLVSFALWLTGWSL